MHELQTIQCKNKMHKMHEKEENNINNAQKYEAKI